MIQLGVDHATQRDMTVIQLLGPHGTPITPPIRVERSPEAVLEAAAASAAFLPPPSLHAPVVYPEHPDGDDEPGVLDRNCVSVGFRSYRLHPPVENPFWDVPRRDVSHLPDPMRTLMYDFLRLAIRDPSPGMPPDQPPRSLLQ